MNPVSFVMWLRMMGEGEVLREEENGLRKRSVTDGRVVERVTDSVDRARFSTIELSLVELR
jgi:hypothetical protein